MITVEVIKEVLTRLFGNNNLNLLYALIILVSLDYITGVCAAIKKGSLSSSIGAKGIANKVAIFVLVALSNIVEEYFVSTEGTLEAITILFYCTNEAISIIENAHVVGIPIPARLINTLEKLKKSEDASSQDEGKKTP